MLSTKLVFDAELKGILLLFTDSKALVAFDLNMVPINCIVVTFPFYGKLELDSSSPYIVTEL